MLRLREPVATDTRSRKADFLELSAFFSARMRASAADLLGALEIADDPAAEIVLYDEETGEELDNSILDQGRQSVELEVFEEFEYRGNCLGSAYPFRVSYSSRTIDFVGEGAFENGAHLTYLFCLLASAIRAKVIEVDHDQSEALKRLERSIGLYFQVCACLAAGAYLTGSVASFGFPRSAGDAFLPALRSAYKRFGVGEVRNNEEDILADLPSSLKDGGIDVIAWRDLPDLMPGKLYLIGQCASGANWRGKSVIEYIDQLHGAWFTEQPAVHSIPAMFIPFPFHHDLDMDQDRSYKGKIKTNYWYEERRYGIIFDRLRIAYLVLRFEALPESTKESIDGLQEMASVRDWVSSLHSLSQTHVRAA